MRKSAHKSKARPFGYPSRAPLPGIVLTVLIGLAVVFPCHPAAAADRVTVVLTANTHGAFSMEPDGQEEKGPLLSLARSILAEKKNGADLVIDLGNAFYPGALSKFSSGSVVMDFMDFFGFDATLVSSADLHIGFSNLEFVRKDKYTRLLSANIVGKEEPVFTPWFEVDVRGQRIAFVGVSSASINFDIAEKEIYGVSLQDARKALEAALETIRQAGIDRVVLLSGLNLAETLELMTAFPAVDLALSGGDYTGELFAGKASRIDLEDGRSVLIAGDGADYYLLDLVADTDGIAVRSMEGRKAAAPATSDYRYQDFKGRLALWKTKFREVENQRLAASGGGDNVIDDNRLCRLLQDRFNSETAIVEEGTLRAIPLKGDIRRSDLLNLVNLDYNVFTFRLTGEQLRAVGGQVEGLVVTGLERDPDFTIQGYALEPARTYRVAATQTALEKIERILGTKIDYRNNWLSVKDLMANDLQDRRVVMLPDYDYLSRRFRVTLDAYLSNIIDSSSVHRDSDIETPVGQPRESYSKWGLENRIDLAIYNKYHRFLLTPYMMYVRQDDDYLHNLLRGTLLYEYNLSKTYRPYNKFQYETVVTSMAGERPSMLRETAGVSYFSTYVNAKLGLGFEKEVQDPSDAPSYGLELILGFRYPILKNLIYSFDLDMFDSVQSGDDWQVRGTVENALVVLINAHLSLTLRHCYFFLYDGDLDSHYSNSQFLTTFDVKTGWKLW